MTVIYNETTSYKELLIILKELPIRVYEKRVLYGLSLRDLEKETGVAFNVISRFERGIDIYHTSAIKLLEWVGEK